MFKRFLMAAAALTVFLQVGGASAQGAASDAGFKRFVVGGSFGFGMGLVAGDYEDLIAAREGADGMQDYTDTKPKFSFSFNAYFDFYFSPMFAIEAGIGFLGKGGKAEIDVDTGWYSFDATMWDRMTYMEIPIAFKLNIHNFQASIGIGMWIALSGETKAEDGDNSQTHEWNDDDWDWVHRFNIGPRIFLGYAIPVGPVSIVPGITWMMHLINDVDTDEIEDDVPGFPDADDIQVRAMNIMFNVGVEFGF